MKIGELSWLSFICSFMLANNIHSTSATDIGIAEFVTEYPQRFWNWWGGGRNKQLI